MGRAYNSLVQEMRGIDDKNYAALKAELKKELIAMMNTADGRCLFYSITPSLTSIGCATCNIPLILPLHRLHCQ